MMRLPCPSPVREALSIDRPSFDERVRRAGAPVVIRGLAANWPIVAAASASDEEFARYCSVFQPSRKVPVVLAKPEANGRFFYSDDLMSFNFERREVTLDFFFDRLINHEKPAANPNAVALQSTLISELLPTFAAANQMPLLDASIEPRIWIGNRIRVAPHYDLAENIAVVVAGRRRFTLFPPEQISNLYTGPLENTPAGTPVSMVDLAAPDLRRFPRFREAAAVAQSATLEPGDAIYIPFSWWHGVDSLDPVSGLVNYWWNQAPSNLPQPYGALTLSIAALRSLPAEHRRAWRILYEHYVFADGDIAAEHLPEPAKGVLGAPSVDILRRLQATLSSLFSR